MAAMAQALATGAVGTHSGDAQQMRILLVEDDNVTLKAVEAILRIHGHYRVTTAMNVPQALQHVKDAKERGEGMFDLVLTDLCLPEVSGLQLIHEITDIPVVVMSCQDSQDSVLQAFEAGAAGYLVKPIRKNEVSTLWQHIWRNNRGKVVSHLAASAAAATDGQTNDSGNSTSTGVPADGQGAGLSSSRAAEAAATLKLADTEAARQAGADTESDQQGCQVHACSSSYDGDDSAHAHGQGSAEIAVIQLDLPLASMRGSQVDELLSSGAVVAAGTPAGAAKQSSGEALACESRSPADQADGSMGPSACSSGADHSSASCMTAQGAHQSAPKAAQPLSRPLATGHDGHPGHLPPGLQELAGLGQPRRQEQAGGSQAPVLWQPHVHKAQQQQQQQQQQQHASAEQESKQESKQEQEHTPGGLNHSCASAFTAVTVFLPRSGTLAASTPRQAGTEPIASACAPAAVNAGASAAQQQGARAQVQQSANATSVATAAAARTLPAETSGNPLFRPVPPPSATASSAAAPAAAEAAISTSVTAASTAAPAQAAAVPALPAGAGAMWPGATLPALQPLVTCIPTASHPAQPTALNQLHYLPQSVIQLICALSAPGANGVLPMATPHAAVPGLARTPSAQMSDGSQSSKASHRQAAVAKYLEKRKIRSFQKKVRYESRKRLAESRPRVKGQFVKQSVLEAAKVPEPPAGERQAPAAMATGLQAAIKGSSESGAAEVLAGLAGTAPLPGKRSRAQLHDEDESDDDVMSDTEP